MFTKLTDRSFMMRKLGWKSLHFGLRQLDQHGDQFTTFHQRPKRAAAFGTRPEKELEIEPTVIVMQGPIFEDYDYTIETLRLYAEHMSGTKVILSTWKDTRQDLVDRARAAGAEVLLSDPPEDPGLYNINMQISSVAPGLRRAAECGATWLMKTRTDQRLHGDGILSFLAAISRQFPVRSGYDQRSRVVGIGHGTLKYAPYHVTDQTLFGQAQDIVNYFDIPLRKTEIPPHWPTTRERMHLDVPIGELCQYGAAESYFASEFLKKVGRPLEWTIQDTWAAYRDHFIFLDSITADFFWVKAQTDSHREILSTYEYLSNRTEVGFRDWFLLYTGALPIEAAARYEGALDTKFTTEIPVEP